MKINIGSREFVDLIDRFAEILNNASYQAKEVKEKEILEEMNNKISNSKKKISKKKRKK